MGWTVYSRFNSPADRAAERAEIIHLHRLVEGYPMRRTVLQASKVGNVWYCAVEDVPTAIGPHKTDSPYLPTVNAAGETCTVFCTVFLTSRQNGEWGYKDMSETMGPCESKAPLNLLAKLSDIPAMPEDEPEYSSLRSVTEWRARCRTHANQPKLEVGMKIRLATPVTMGDSGPMTDFEVSQYRTRRGRMMRSFKSLCPARVHIRLHKDYLQSFEVIAE